MSSASRTSDRVSSASTAITIGTTAGIAETGTIAATAAIVGTVVERTEVVRTASSSTATDAGIVAIADGDVSASTSSSSRRRRLSQTARRSAGSTLRAMAGSFGARPTATSLKQAMHTCLPISCASMACAEAT